MGKNTQDEIKERISREGYNIGVKPLIENGLYRDAFMILSKHQEWKPFMSEDNVRKMYDYTESLLNKYIERVSLLASDNNMLKSRLSDLEMSATGRGRGL